MAWKRNDIRPNNEQCQQITLPCLVTSFFSYLCTSTPNPGVLNYILWRLLAVRCATFFYGIVKEYLLVNIPHRPKIL